MKLFFASIWLALGALFFHPPVQTCAVRGVIRHLETGAPLPDAQVRVLRQYAVLQETRSGARGEYRLALAPGRYDLECSYPGFVTQRIADVSIGATDTVLYLPVALRPGAQLEEVSTVTFEAYHRMTDVAPATTGEPAALTTEDIPASGRVLTADEIKSMPTRPVSAVLAKPAATPAEMPADYAVAVKGARSRGDEAGPVKKARSETAAPAGGEREALSEVVVTGVKAPKKHAEKAKMREVKAADRRDVATDDREESHAGMPEQPSPRAGLLTAGEWNDLNNWNRHWVDLLNDGEINDYQKTYAFYPKHRYTVLLTNERDYPVADAVVTLFDASDKAIWECRTDNTGKAELWSGLFDATHAPGRVSARATLNGKTVDLGALKPAKEGLNHRKVAAECGAPQQVDIVWAVDATGSMGDEIEYLKTELLDVIGRAKSLNPGLSFRMGTVFYRDKEDEYLTQSSGLSYDIGKTVDFIRKQFAGGGGDYPEAVESALEEAVYNQRWSEHAIARICFLVLDASPHQTPEVNERLQRSIREAARRGIRIVPVAASGIQKDTEFLMKFFGLATNGTYVFLTDHSGVGGKHLEATADEYKVEPLNNLLVRLLTEYTATQSCEGKLAIRFEDPQQGGKDWQALYYPNPASGQFTLELPVSVQSITLYDPEGKAVKKLERVAAGTQTVSLGEVADGVYTLRIHKDNQLQSGKLVVARL